MNALTAGAIGAATTNLAHEGVRRTLPDAPRVDLLGMQALAKIIGARSEPPSGRRLYVSTLIGDLISNSAYFSLISLAPRRHAVKAGLAVGVLAGIGAVTLPPLLGLDAGLTASSAQKKALTIALYAAGGVATGFALRDDR